MKNLFVSLLFILSFCAFCFAQSKLPEFDKAKEIKLLQSTREDVKKIFAGYEHDDSEEENYVQFFYTDNAQIQVTFSAGDCTDEDSEEIWNVAEWTVTKIKITPEETLKLEDFKFDFSRFEKEITDEEDTESFNYHDESSGIFFRINDSEIEKIIFYPPQSNIAYICTNEYTSEVISGEKRIIDLILENDSSCNFIDLPANVIELNLSAEEILIGCSDISKNKTCKVGKSKVSVSTSAVDPEGAPLVYVYEISAGEIIGRGFNVVWDLTGVPPGTYFITAGVDDGAGVVGQTITKTVVVRECSECSQIQKTEPSKP